MIPNTLKTLLLATMIGTIAGGNSAAQTPRVDAQTAFNLLKTLEGSWTAQHGPGKTATSRFELTANGTVLVEHYVNPAIPGGQMMNAYHLDGQDLVLTHYCVARNQPTLRAERFDAATSEMQFEFLRATNLVTLDAGHMRRAKYRVIDRNTFVTEWEFFDKGIKTLTEVESFTRVK